MQSKEVTDRVSSVRVSGDTRGILHTSLGKSSSVDLRYFEEPYFRCRCGYSRILAKVTCHGAAPSFTFWPPPFKFESAMLQSAGGTVFDADAGLNVHSRHTSSGKTEAVGAWHALICK